jgi:HPt (histidine-containing phosphotransfer) domain-containing protein
VNAPLLAKYGRRFVGSARERLAGVAELDGPEAAAAARSLALHLHSISGEAAMIGLPELSQLAREAMGTARAVENDAAQSSACAAQIGAILRALDALEAGLSAPSG